MLIGKIVVHEEPKKYKTQNFQGAGFDDDDYGLAWYGRKYSSSSKENYTKTALETIIARAVNNGFVIGARVVRSSGNPGIGSIVCIHHDLENAYNEEDREFTPFRVTWDTSPIFTGGSFDYAAQDLRLASTVSNLPAKLLEYKDENLSDLHYAC